MPIHAIQSNFVGGEVSPHLYSRVDAATYSSWLKTSCNFIIHPQGGASNRPGTAFVNQAKYSNKKCRLIPFVLSEEEAYVLEVGHQYIRIHTQAGTLLDGEDIYELETPYLEHELDQIQYVQYEGILYLSHPTHYPHKLVCQAQGVFSFVPLNITDGPFMPGNTDEDKKVRLISTSDTVYSDGVKAFLSFLPINYPNYIIQAYWRGERFYDPSGYGFNVAEVVQYFNQRYTASTGCVAYNQGGVLRIESPQATGGDYNGSELVIYYKSGLFSAPKLIVTQVMDGGQNAGEVPGGGETHWYLESDFDVFEPGHEGALWSLSHRVESSYETGTLGNEGISHVIKTGGDWGLRTMGTWYGELVLESSEDQVTWQKVKHFTKAQSEDNFNTLGNLEASAKMYYLRVRCLGISGELGYILQSNAFYQEGIVKLTQYVGPRKMQVSIERQPGDLSSWTSDWAEGSFSAKAGFPGSVFLYQNRLGFACTRQEAQSLWFSKTGEYENFGYLRTLADSDAISVNLSSNKLNAIRSVAAGNKLLVFTTGSEWSVSSNGPFTPYSAGVVQEGERGATVTQPLMIGNRVLYVQARGGSLRDFYYEYSGDCYTGRDLTLRAKHLFSNREIKELAYQQEPDHVVWCVLDDGQLLSLTYLPEENVAAWSRHQTQGEFVSVCSIPAVGYDETWFLVHRGNGYCIERLLPRLQSKLPEDQVFLDAAISKKMLTPFTTVNGLAHLEGKQISVLADGSPLTGLAVENGQLVLPQAVHTVHVGLAYQAKLQTLPLDFNLQDGTAQDRKRRLVRVMVKLLDSRGGYIGAGEGPLDELFYAPILRYALAPSLQTTDVHKVVSAVHNYFPSITFVQSDPLPVTILAFLSELS